MKRGRVVAIINCTPGGKFFYEGDAIVLTFRRDAQSTVRFVESGDECERFIDPQAQASPRAFAKSLNARVAGGGK